MPPDPYFKTTVQWVIVFTEEAPVLSPAEKLEFDALAAMTGQTQFKSKNDLFVQKLGVRIDSSRATAAQAAAVEHEADRP
jgi:hypothetical protein